jgi:hypothetical protein
MYLTQTKLAKPAIKIASIVATTVLLASASWSRENSTFLLMAGDWNGSGTVTANGRTERISCKVRYEVNFEQTSLMQNMVCASDSYRFDIASSIFDRDGKLTGQWSERTRGINGRVTGRLTGNQIDAEVEGPDVSSVAISFRRTR